MSEYVKGARCCWCSADAERPVVPHRWFCKRCSQWQSTPEDIQRAMRGAREAVHRFGEALERLADA